MKQDNPYETSAMATMIADRSLMGRMREWYLQPFPVRIGNEHAFQWIVDSIVMVMLWIVGCGIADLCRHALWFLEPTAYTVSLTIGWFPIGMWIHYCRVSQFTGSTAIALISVLLAIRAISAEGQSLFSLLIAIPILMIVLPCEHLLGKFVLGWLPSSSTRELREHIKD
jgi:hypothetical protein